MPIDRNGPVTRGTRENLIRGLRARPITQEAAVAALAQAGRFAELLANTYEAEIAEGEVGIGGSGRASDAAILGDRPPTALLYGRIQSGKTAAMILTAALALDNHFRIIVVLTADNVVLVQQTADRFRALDGPRVFSAGRDETYEWEGQEDEIRQDIADDGLVFVCPKNAFHLPRVINFLQQIEASLYPALIFDDEADAATPDTTQAARASGRPNAPLYPSTIYRRVIENIRPGEEGQSVNEVFPHSLYVQVTATPYVLLLQRTDARTRPNTTFLLEAGEGYCGGRVFFGEFDPDADAPDAPVVLVPNNEGRALNLRAIPPGLAASIDFFVVAAAAKALADNNTWPTEGYKHLSHPSWNINQHTVVASHIDRHLNELRRLLRAGNNEVIARLASAYEELRRTNPRAPDLVDIAAILPEAIRQAEVIRINSENEVRRYGPRLNFLVGGNILGRGLTIDDLLVTYYVREAQVSQMDTMWQHARMYGYREGLMPYTRAYMPRRVASRFKGIHESEEALRELLRRQSVGENILIRIAPGTRVTRPNALEPSALRVIGPGLDQLFPWYLVESVQTSARIKQVLEGVGVPLEDAARERRPTQIPLTIMMDLIATVPIRGDDPGRWTVDDILALVELYREDYAGNAIVYVRGLQDEPIPARGWSRGRLGGEDIRVVRAASPEVPALALLHYGGSANPRAWYPTLVLPEDSPAYVINAL